MEMDNKTGGIIPRFSGEEILEKIPQVFELAEIECYNFGKYPGPHMTPELMFRLSTEIKKKLSETHYTGVVVTHGTDTLEETAYLLDLSVDTEVPIVITGSMKSSSEPDWDGAQNLIDSVRVSLNKNCRNLGALVCLNGEINAASEVAKIFTDEIDTFRSIDFGALGFVKGDKVILNRLPHNPKKLLTDKINTNVDLLKVYAGMGSKFFIYSADSGAEGLVVEALGIGNVTPAAFEGIKYVVKKGIPVVLVSRCPAGETGYIYSYPGAGKHLHDIGVIFADFLNGQKARIKFMLALGVTRDKSLLKKIFEH